MYSRLTTATMYGSLMNSLQSAQRNIQDLQQQIASGNKYTKLSDNPAAISRSQTVQSAINANTQYQENTRDALTMLRHANSALQNVLDAAKSIRNLIIEAGDAALDSSQLKDITAQIEANKKIMLDNLNTKVAGQYLFGGTSTGTAPFIEKSDGSIEYQGSDERIKYVLSESLLGDISFTGSDIIPENEDTYFICSHYVPLDWRWTGREEKVQITVGNRTLAVFIPEDWSDNDITKTNKHTDEYISEENIQSLNFSDANGFRDPNELSGISLEDLATIINRSLEEQGADMLVNAYIERDYDSGTQQLIIKSNTGEKVGITGWPDTDYMPMPATIRSLDLSSRDCEGWNDEGSSITISTLEGNVTPVTIDITEDDTPETLAGKINAIEGIYARHSADGNSIEILAERIGDIPEDRLNVDEAQETLHYPSLVVSAEGGALKMFGEFLDESGEVSQNSVIVKSTVRNTDQSHIDIFDYLGMETATKSREFSPDETLTVESGTQLHWRVISGGRSVDVKLNSGEYTIEKIAERLKNAGAGWLEVTVEPGGHDVTESTLENHSDDYEEETKRIVMRGYNGEQVIFLDMNEYNYADKLGVSTALRTDAYENSAGRGMKCVNFPSAPCVDDNVGVPMRVQMNCGMYYDVNIKRADVVDSSTGFVDRALLMQEIVDQVNEIEGHDIMGFAQHVDSTGKDIEGSCSMYFLSGEAFTVVDMPFDDPEWNDYSGGLAVQLGIHGGVSSNLQQTHIKMLDNATFAEAYDSDTDKYGEVDANPDSLDFREGTIRFSNLAHSVEIDVNVNDTVKDIMDRLRVQAGDWLYVNYYDTNMGQDATRNTGNYPLISISSKDGSAVNVLDIKGHIAEDALGLSTAIQSRLNYDGTSSGIMDFEWEVNEQAYDDGGAVNFPADVLNITVAGYTHTLDLTSIRDVTNDDTIKADDVAEFINSRMQDYDVKAEINADNELMIYSPRGYSIEISFLENVTDNFIGSVNSGAARVTSSGVSSNLEQTSKKIKKDETFADIYGSDFRDSTIKFSNSSKSVEIDINSTDTVEDVMNRIQTEAGSWLKVNYDDTGDYPSISLYASNGSALSVIDMRGHIAEDVLGISTGIQGRLNGDGTGDGAMALEWDLENKSFPAEQVNLTVNGVTHSVDLTQIGGFVTDKDVTTDDVADYINYKMQDYDIRAAINADNEIVIYSPGGSPVKVKFLNNANEEFLGEDNYILSRTHYRGGYGLEGKAYYDGENDPRGVDSDNLYSSGMHTQNATIRSGANTARQNAFGTINDVMAAIESGNRDDLQKKMLPRIDNMINNILGVMAEDGALQARYNYNTERLTTESAVMTEDYDNLMKIDPADAISQLMIADYMYQANLAVIARLIQPSLLDFLG